MEEDKDKGNNELVDKCLEEYNNRYGDKTHHNKLVRTKRDSFIEEDENNKPVKYRDEYSKGENKIDLLKINLPNWFLYSQLAFPQKMMINIKNFFGDKDGVMEKLESMKYMDEGIKYSSIAMKKGISCCQEIKAKAIEHCEDSFRKYLSKIEEYGQCQIRYGCMNIDLIHINEKIKQDKELLERFEKAEEITKKYRNYEKYMDILEKRVNLEKNVEMGELRFILLNTDVETEEKIMPIIHAHSRILFNNAILFRRVYGVALTYETGCIFLADRLEELKKCIDLCRQEKEFGNMNRLYQIVEDIGKPLLADPEEAQISESFSDKRLKEFAIYAYKEIDKSSRKKKEAAIIDFNARKDRFEKRLIADKSEKNE